MKIQMNKAFIFILFMVTSLFLLYNPEKSDAGCPSDSSEYFSSPSFVSVKVQPNVLVILDNSASMNSLAYPTTVAFDPGRNYYGLFDSDRSYSYDNVNHFFQEVGDTYDDPGTANVFERYAGDLTSARLFSGNWLNWWTMRRIDVAKKVLTGGKIAPDTTDTVLEGSPMDRDRTRTYNDAGPLFHTPFRQAIYSYFFSTDRGDTLGGAQDQFTAMFSTLVLNAAGADLSVPAVPADNGNNTGESTIPYNGLNYNGYVVAVKIEADDIPVLGIVQKMENFVRFGYMNFHAGNGPGEGWAVNQNIFNWDIDQDGTADVRRFSADGGRVRDYVGSLNTAINPHGDTVSQITQNINEQISYSNTPLSETLWEAVKYFKQDAPAFIAPANDVYTPPNNTVNYEQNNEWDPYFFNNLGDAGEFVRCAKSFIIYLSDGAPTQDSGVPTNNWPNGATASFNGNDNIRMLDDIAFNMHTQDLRVDGSGGMGYASETVDQTIKLYTVFTFDTNLTAKAELMKAARAGGFNDLDGNGDITNNGDTGGTVSSTDPAAFVGNPEWDADNDNVPDTFYEAQDGAALEKALMDALGEITSDASSGTAAAVVSNARGGEGAIYQAVFYPKSTTNDFISGQPIKWYGNVHALFIDKYGYRHEDTPPQDGILDLDTDLVIEYSGTTGEVLKYDFDPIAKTLTQITATAGDGNTSNGDLNDNGVFEVDEIFYPWDALSWFRTINDADFEIQRDYRKNDKKRFIFTDFIDTAIDATMNSNIDNNVDSTQQTPFVATEAFVTDTTHDNYFFFDPFIAYDHDSDPFTPDIGYSEAQMTTEAANIVNFIRGKEGLLQTGTGIPYRDRTLNNPDGSATYMGLGDIIHSSPTVVSRTEEEFDMIYNDASFVAFKRQYKDRRAVIYVGANDGMLHAFNAGFYDAKNHQILKSPMIFDSATASDVPAVWDDTNAVWTIDPTPSGDNYKYELGAELWAYVPNALLPHLKWLKESLSGDDHIYYVNLKPRIFDAKIFDPTDPDHPGGWGTILLGGMGLGGGTTQVDTTVDTNPASTTFGDPFPDGSCEMTFTSTYFAIDITNPEHEPELLWSFTDSDLGFTTSYPTPIRVNEAWFVILGSGPHNYTAVNDPTVPVVYGGTNKKGYVYVLNARTGDLERKFEMEDDSFMQHPVAIDINLETTTSVTGELNYAGDAIYIASDGADGGNPGKIFRFITNQDIDPNNWTSTVFFDPNSGNSPAPADHQHISAAINVAKDDKNQVWVYFGTGRNWGTFDKQSPYFEYQNSFYGIKEPSILDSDGKRWLVWGTEAKSNLFNTSNIIINEDGTIDGSPTISDREPDGDVDFDDLIKTVEYDYSGWYIDFDETGERELAQAAVFSEIVFFTTYIPANDVCDASGESYIYGLHYQTGTALPEGLLLTDDNNFTGVDPTNARVIKKIRLGNGLTSTPNIQVVEGGKVKIILQMSSGSGGPPMPATNTPGITRSQKSSWRMLPTE